MAILINGSRLILDESSTSKMSTTDLLSLFAHLLGLLSLAIIFAILSYFSAIGLCITF